MARANLIESSDHFDEIIERLSRGDKGVDVSRWLEETYNEKISPRTMNRYKKNIKMEDRVEAELNKRAEENHEKLTSQTEVEVQRQADEIEADKKETQRKKEIKESAEETLKTVTNTIADNMQGVAKVAAELPAMFEKAKLDAADPDTNVTFKDVTNITLQANRIFADYFKDNEPDIEVNVNNEVIGLSDSIEASRQKYVKWKEEQIKKKKE